MEFDRILVPLDFSDGSLNALRVACERFASSEATLVLLNVVENPTVPETPQGFFNDQLGTVDMHRRLRTAMDYERGWKDVLTAVEYGKPAVQILEAIEEHRINLVIIGSHGTSSISKALFGSTTYHVARKCGCSVVIVKPER